ncbi:MAG TPA: alpha/beta hydrolase [Xanthomonadales bacterium]|nr:alpha/beta hydrolase [Xanthomonadales bacterium]
MSPRELELDLPHLTLAARAWGEPGGSRVLALHGWLDNAASFDALAPLLDGVELVALDLPGHGRSQHRPPGNWYHYVDYLDDVLAAADALGWNRCTLLGHSLGGAIASALAAVVPERVDALWLVEALGPVATPVEKTREQIARAVAQRRALADKSLRVFDSIDAAVEARVNSPVAPVSREAARRIVERGIRAHAGGYVWASDPRLTLASAMRSSEAQVLDVLAGIACPTLVVLADPPAPYVAREMIERRTAVVPRLERVTLPGSHHLHLEDPVPVARAIAAFRKKGDAPH